MLRTSILLLISLICGKSFAGVNVELDVVFSDSTVQCRYLYVLAPGTVGVNDTIAVFDTLSFNGQNRLSLFYTVRSDGKNTLSIVDAAGVHLRSKPFRVSPQRTTFKVDVMQQQIKITGKDFLYPQKNEDGRSYFVFLTIFFVIKILIATVFVFVSKQRKPIIAIASGAFLLSALIDWFISFDYLYRFLMMILAEYLLIALVGRRFIAWLQAAMLVLTVNMIGFGMIVMLYVLYVFW
jgi:hypothetical protein